MTLYHETLASVVRTILESGFSDGPGRYRTKTGWRKGVWFSDDLTEFAPSGNVHWALLQIELDLSAEELEPFRWTDDGRRLWLIPAAKVNASLRQCVQI